jgi:hypothetical protein
MPIDPEMHAIRRVLKTLEPLNGAQRRSVLQYVFQRTENGASQFAHAQEGAQQQRYFNSDGTLGLNTAR